MEFQELAKMGNRWELIEVNYATCDECWSHTVCNIYSRDWGCNCMKCREMGKLFKLKNICGSCMGKWLKSRDMDNAE